MPRLGHVLDDDEGFTQARALERAPAPLSGDELELVGRDPRLAYYEGLD